MVFNLGEYHRALTTNLIHSDLKHLISNSYMLFFLGILIYNSFGFLLFPFLSLTFSIIVTLLGLYTYPENNILLGASGWVYLLGGCWASLYVILDTRISVFSRIFKAIAVSLIIFWPQTLLPEVSYRTHAIGYFIGLITGIFYFLIKRKHLRSFEEYPEEELIDDQSDPQFFE
jgi:rhomboid protease GluP